MTTQNQENIQIAHSTNRQDGRAPHQLRDIKFHLGFAPAALGSVLIQWGNTHVICAVTMEASVPKWMRDQNVVGGWITAEYSMLPYSTPERKPREITKGRPEGRTQEIQRIIGRALRAAVDLEALGEMTLWIDCDVVQADGGTRTASITGAYVALVMAIDRLLKQGKLTQNPLRHQVAAVSVGLIDRQPFLDLNFAEDTVADVDMTLIMTRDGQFVEIHAIGEQACFTEDEFVQMMALGKQGLSQIFDAQLNSIGLDPTKLSPPSPPPEPHPTPQANQPNSI
jgi:ribonuclease PH